MLARVWNLRLNLDALNADFMSLSDDTEKGQYLSGLCSGANKGRLRNDSSVPFSEGFSLGQEMREEAEGLRSANSINGAKGGRQKLPEMQPTGSPIGLPSGEPYPESLILNPLTKNEKSKEVVTAVSETTRHPRVPPWAKAHDQEVLLAASEVCSPWPHPKTDMQPDGKTPVPHISLPEVGQRLAEIRKEGGSLEICKAIATRVVTEFRTSAGKWIKAPQHFFGKAPDAPWRAYYQAHITNEATMKQKAAQTPTSEVPSDGQPED